MSKKFIQKRTGFGVMLLGAFLLSGAYAFSQTCNANDLIDEAEAIVNNEAGYTVPSVTELKRRLVAAKNDRNDCILTDGLRQAINNMQGNEMPYNIVINIYQNPTNQMAFNWFTNANVTGGEVQIVQGEADENAFATPWQTFPATCKQVSLNYNIPENDLLNLTGIANNTPKTYTENKARATGLTPNTLYSFRTGKANAWSDVGTFRTAPDNTNDFSFIYTTDPQSVSYEEFDISQRASHAAFGEYPDANFWLHCGDMVESRADSEWEWEQFFETQQDLFYKYPFAPVMGNHDSGHPYRSFRKHLNTENQGFDLTWNPESSGSNYSFVYGDALFLAINSEERESEYHHLIITWLRNEVKKYPDVKWRIVYCHRGLYTGANHQSEDRNWRDNMAPVFDELHINLALQGHDHIYEVIGPVYDKQLVEGAVSHQKTATMNDPENVTGKSGGVYNTQEGTLYFLNNSSGKKKFNPRSESQMIAAQGTTGIDNYFGLFTGRFGQTGRPAFSNVRVTADTIFITTHEVFDDGHVELFDVIKVIQSIPVTGVTVSPSVLSLKVGETATLTTTVEPDDATTKTVTWSSNGNAIAAVNVTTGEVTAVSGGEAIITATTRDGGKTSDCTVTVTVPVTGVILNNSTLTLAVGESEQLIHNIEPANATNKNVIWDASNEAIVTVSDGMVTAMAVGNATVTVVTDYGKFSAACDVTVTPATIPVTGVHLNNSALTLTVGESEQLIHNVEPANATNKNITWSSANEDIAKVENGLVTAVSAGETTIAVIADDGGFTSACVVTVTAATIPVTGVSLSHTALSHTKGDTKTLIATVVPDNATNKNVTWKSSNETIVTVSDGTITAKAAGSASITATTEDGGFTASCTVTVTPVTNAETIDKPLAKLYPNPTDGRFILHFETQGTHSITIATMSGAILLRQTVNDRMVQMDISSYPAGIYLVMIDDGKRQSIIKAVKEK